MNTKQTSISRRQALTLAAALTLAVGTASVAVGGITHAPQAAPAVTQVVSPAAQPAHSTEADD